MLNRTTINYLRSLLKIFLRVRKEQTHWNELCIFLLQDCQNDWNDAECAIKCVPVTDPSTNITYSKLYKVQ